MDEPSESDHKLRPRNRNEHHTFKNLYIYGGTLWATLYLLFGLTTAGTLPGAIGIVFDVYIMKLFGWPWSELLLADTLWGLIRSHAQTWFVGWAVATLNYGINS